MLGFVIGYWIQGCRLELGSAPCARKAKELYSQANWSQLFYSFNRVFMLFNWRDLSMLRNKLDVSILCTVNSDGFAVLLLKERVYVLDDGQESPQKANIMAILASC